MPRIIGADVRGEDVPPTQPAGRNRPSKSRFQSLSGVDWTSWSPRNRVALIGGAVGVVALLGLAGIWSASRAEPETDEALSAPTPSAAPEPRPVVACQLLPVPPRKLSGSIHLPVPPTAIATDSGFGIAFASTAREAVGLHLDPSSLDAARAFTEPGTSDLIAVDVIRQADEATYRTARVREGTLTSAFVRVGTQHAELAVTQRGIVVRAPAGEHLVWTETAGKETTSPRTAGLPDGGAIVALRTGGTSGHVFVGELDAEAKSTAPLTPVTSTATEFGTPNVAVGSNEVALAFAARENGPWRVELARAPIGRTPASSRAFETPEASAQTIQIAPALAPVHDRGWLLQWTESAGQSYRVRLQTLDEQFRPVGPIIEASESSQNAGQGLVAVHGDRAVSLYVVRPKVQGAAPELWARALSCP